MSHLTAFSAPHREEPRAKGCSLHSEDGFLIIATLVGVLLSAQLYLVWFKSFNWDEFLHFSQVYRAREGTLSQPFQVLHSRILWWAPEAAVNLIDQMRAARLFLWGTHLLTLFMIFSLARQFTTDRNAFFAAFAYMTAGYVFAHSFSIRSDPLVTVTLMTALYLLAKEKFSFRKAVVIGALVGVAGMMTLKAVLYAPCFASLAWLKYKEAPNRQFIGKLATLFIAALASFVATYLYHHADLAPVPKRLDGAPIIAHGLQWFTAGLAPKAEYILREVVLAPIFFAALVLTPFAWRRANITKNVKIAMLGFVLPLVTLILYRNTFPYFFVFILAPVAVAIAPALGMIRDRIGSVALSVLLAIVPILLTTSQPKDPLIQQQSLIDYVHQEYPEKTGYLEYAGLIADYPRILIHLTSGVEMASYHDRGEATVASDIEAGHVPFIIADHVNISAALRGKPVPGTFLPADATAMSSNYVHQWGALWREGKAIPAGADPFSFSLVREGRFTLSGRTLIIDGKVVKPGATITLDKGMHVVTNNRKSASVLWRGNKLPAPPPKIEPAPLFTSF